MLLLTVFFKRYNAIYIIYDIYTYVNYVIYKYTSLNYMANLSKFKPFDLYMYIFYMFLPS